MAVIQI